MAKKRFEDYWQLRMDGATSRLKAALAIIEHTGTRGSLAETMLREVIAEFLPNRWGAGTGFIVHEKRGISRQIDILLYDLLTQSALYRDGELVALSPGAARVAIEVKSDLNGESIAESLENVASVKGVDPKVVGLVFGYRGVTAPYFKQHAAAWIRARRASGTFIREHLPDAFYNMEHEYVVYRMPSNGPALYNAKEARDPVTRFLFTRVLAALNLVNLRPFMRADRFKNKRALFEL